MNPDSYEISAAKAEEIRKRIEDFERGFVECVICGAKLYDIGLPFCIDCEDERKEVEKLISRLRKVRNLKEIK